MTLPIEKIKQIREMAKEGRSKIYVARMIGCNRRTVHSYWPKTEEEKKPELSKRIFQMLEEGCSPIKVVEQLGYPAYVQKQVKTFKRLKQQELNEFLAKVDEGRKVFMILQAEMRHLRENKEKEEKMIHQLSTKKDKLEEEIIHQKKVLSSFKNQINDERRKYDQLKLSLAVKKDLMFFDKFLENPTSVSPRVVSVIVGVVMDAFYKWAKLENNKKIFNEDIFYEREFPPFFYASIEDVIKGLRVLCKKFYSIVPQNLRELMIEEILSKEIPDFLKQLAVKEGYEEALKTLTYYSCSICGKDMIITKEQLRQAVRKGGWAHSSCIKQKKNKGKAYS